MGYKEIAIRPHPAGFGMFDRVSSEEIWSDDTDMLAEMSGNGVQAVELSDALSDPEFLAAGVEDIKGRIYGGDPTTIYASLINDELVYFGIDEVME
jgi:hypothetical protein